MIQVGLLLVPERIHFPFARQVGFQKDSGTNVDQLRSCFTFLQSHELVAHSARFGAYSLEFDMEVLRRLGAFPVVYVPQPILESHGGPELSLIGNTLVHQIRDVSVLLQELLSLEETVQHAVDLDAQIRVTTRRKSGTTSLGAVSLILDHLLGDKKSFVNLLNYVELLGQMFYHSDSARAGRYILGPDLNYYNQREWRVISGFEGFARPFDRELTQSERKRLSALSDFFNKLVDCKDGRRAKRVELTRVLSKIDHEPMCAHVRAFHVPDVVLTSIRAEFEAVVPANKFVGIPYEEVLAARVASNRMQGNEIRGTEK